MFLSIIIVLQFSVLAVGLLFPSFGVSFVCSVVPILKIIRRNMNTVTNCW